VHEQDQGGQAEDLNEDLGDGRRRHAFVRLEQPGKVEWLKQQSDSRQDRQLFDPRSPQTGRGDKQTSPNATNPTLNSTVRICDPRRAARRGSRPTSRSAMSRSFGLGKYERTARHQVYWPFLVTPSTRPTQTPEESPTTKMLTIIPRSRLAVQGPHFIWEIRTITSATSCEF